jgi:hypothetical protein
MQKGIDVYGAFKAGIRFNSGAGQHLGRKPAMVLFAALHARTTAACTSRRPGGPTRTSPATEHGKDPYKDGRWSVKQGKKSQILRMPFIVSELWDKMRDCADPKHPSYPCPGIVPTTCAPTRPADAGVVAPDAVIGGDVGDGPVGDASPAGDSRSSTDFSSGSASTRSRAPRVAPTAAAAARAAAPRRSQAWRCSCFCSCGPCVVAASGEIIRRARLLRQGSRQQQHERGRALRGIAAEHPVGVGAAGHDRMVKNDHTTRAALMFMFSGARAARAAR